MQISQVLNNDTLNPTFNNAETDTLVTGTIDSISASKNLISSNSKAGKFITEKNTSQQWTAPEKLIITNYDFLFGFIVLCLIVITWAKFVYNKRLLQVFQAFSGRNYANQFAREGNLFKERIYFPLLVSSIISYALLFVSSALYFGRNGPFDFLTSFLPLLGIIGAYWLLKSLMVIILGHVFKTTESTRDYLLNMHIFFIIGGILSLPPTSISLYYKPEIFISVSFGILAIVFILWLFRALQIGLEEKHFSKFHLFLYLCTLEFLPIIILAKIVFKSNFF